MPKFKLLNGKKQQNDATDCTTLCFHRNLSFGSKSFSFSLGFLSFYFSSWTVLPVWEFHRQLQSFKGSITNPETWIMLPICHLEVNGKANHHRNLGFWKLLEGEMEKIGIALILLLGISYRIAWGSPTEAKVLWYTRYLKKCMKISKWILFHLRSL